MTIPLTDMFDEISEEGYRKSPPGMAHWSGTGPKKTRCWQCLHFRAYGYYSRRGTKAGKLKAGTCQRFARMMSHIKAPKFDAETRSCKYFEQNQNPPALFSKR